MPRVTISEPGKTPQPYRFKLERKVVKIGRSSESDIIIECGSASTNHSTKERIEGGYILRDNASTNGIKQGDTLMEVIDLSDGMEILIGDVPMKFQLSESEIEALGKEDFNSHQKKKLPPNKDDSKEQKTTTTTAGTSSTGKRAAQSTSIPPRVQSSAASVSFFVVFILMIAGIIVGMTVRHYRETGDFLIGKWIHGTEQKTLEEDTSSQKKEPKKSQTATPTEE